MEIINNQINQLENEKLFKDIEKKCKKLNEVIEKKINKYNTNEQLREKLNKLVNEKVKKYSTIKSQKVPLFKSGKFAGKSYLDVMQNDESRNYILSSNSIGYGKFKKIMKKLKALI